MSSFLRKSILMKDLNSPTFKQMLRMLKEPLRELKKPILKKRRSKVVKVSKKKISQDSHFGSRMSYNLSSTRS